MKKFLHKLFCWYWIIFNKPMKRVVVESGGSKQVLVYAQTKKGTKYLLSMDSPEQFNKIFIKREVSGI